MPPQDMFGGGGENPSWANVGVGGEYFAPPPVYRPPPPQRYRPPQPPPSSVARPAAQTMGPSTSTPWRPSSIPQLPYQPSAPDVQRISGLMEQYGKGLMDPGSDYSRRLAEEMRREIGEQSAAGGRSAALRAAWSGFGGGASPELLSTQGDIATAGLEATGRGAAGLALAGPQLGLQALGAPLQAQMGLQSQALQGYLSQQQLQAEQQWREIQAQLDRERQAQELMMRQFAMFQGMF